MKNLTLTICLLFTGTYFSFAQQAVASSAKQATPVISADKNPQPAASYNVVKADEAPKTCSGKEGVAGKACCAGHTEAKSCSGHETKSSSKEGAPAGCAKSSTGCSHASSEKNPQ